MIFIINKTRFWEYSKDSLHKKGVEKVLENMESHTWYLDSALVPLCLVDDNTPSDQKLEIAKKLLEFEPLGKGNYIHQCWMWKS